MTQENKDSILKFFLFGSVLFILSLIYVILRDLKDVVIVTSPQGKASIILTLKTLAFWVKVLALGLFFLFYRKNNLLQIMFSSIIILLLFFIAFHFLIYSQAASLHPSPARIQELIHKYPGVENVILAYGIWTYSLYYLLADLWGTFVLTFLFWALANQTFTTQESKLAYPLLFIFPSFGLLLGGILITYDVSGNLQNIVDRCGYVFVGGAILFILFNWLTQRNQSTQPPAIGVEPPPSIPLPLRFNMLYLTLIFVIITCFGFCEQLVKSIWKRFLIEYYTSPDSYAAFMGSYSYYLGIGSLIISLLTFWMIWKFGWLKSALIPPLVTLGTALLFIIYMLTPSLKIATANFFNTSGIALIVGLFSLQMIILKGIGILFLATKEMAYIPLAITTKARGKAIVDFLLGGGLGSTLIVVFMTFDFIPLGHGAEMAVLPTLIILCVTTIVWMAAVVYLGKMYKKALEQDVVKS